MWFPTETATAVVNSDGNWEIDFPEFKTDRVIQWLAITGPPGSSLSVYFNTIFVDATPRGDINRADYFTGMVLARGQQLRLVWNVGSGSAGTASMGSTDGVTTVQDGQTGNSSLFSMAAN